MILPAIYNPKGKDENEMLLIWHLILNARFLKDLGLYHGKMGITIFFLHYARSTGETIYDEFAKELLDEIFDEIHEEVPINFENGLCGIGWAIEYLLENRFIKGNSDEILCEIDHKIMEKDIRRVKDNSVKTGLEGVFYYVKKRLNSRNRDSCFTPFDNRYLLDWEEISTSFLLPLDSILLLDIIHELPKVDSFYKWKLGLNNGCAGYLLKNILNG